MSSRNFQQSAQAPGEGEAHTRGDDVPNVGAGPLTEKKVPKELSRTPLDNVVRTLFETTWGKARSWIGSGKIAVDGAPWTDGRKPVFENSIIALRMNAPRKQSVSTRSGEQPEVVFFDTHVVVVAKPTGMSTVPYDEAETGTLDEWVRSWLEKRSRQERGRPPLGIVHRIDKETSGLVVFTRTWLAKESLAAQFRSHTVQRRYLAIAHGHVAPQTVRTHILADRGDGLRGSRELIPKGRAGKTGDGQGQLAITHVEVVERFADATLIACRLETGRTHQIRIHLSEIGQGHPILGERVYIRSFRRNERVEIPAPRLMLHAAELGFIHPATETEMRWERELPSDMASVLERVRSSASPSTSVRNFVRKD